MNPLNQRFKKSALCKNCRATESIKSFPWIIPCLCLTKRAVSSLCEESIETNEAKERLMGLSRPLFTGGLKNRLLVSGKDC